MYRLTSSTILLGSQGTVSWQ